MKNKIAILSLALLLPLASFGQKSKAKMKNESDTISYSMGVALGSSMKKMGITSINDKLFIQAITESIGGTEALFTDEQVNKIMQGYLTKLHDKKVAEATEKGQKFLDENKKKEGVITLPSGLQYKVIKNGEGEMPALTDKVTCHYHGTLIDGKVFDSSVQRGEPVQFPVNGVIAGWTEALQLMKTGSKWTLYIPANLAYGDKEIPGIDPNSVLIFDVELISIEKGTTEPVIAPVAPEQAQ